MNRNGNKDNITDLNKDRFLAIELDDLEFNAEIEDLKNQIERFEELVLPEPIMARSKKTNYLKNKESLKLQSEFNTLVQISENEGIDAQLCEKMEILLARQDALYEEYRESRSSELKEVFENRKKESLLKKEEKFTKLLEEKNQTLAEVTQKQRNLELHLASLQLQLSPHFIFNSLQSIQSYILKKNSVVASDYLSQFARLMRAIIKSSAKDSLAIYEEIELLEDYLQLEQERFNFSFTYNIETRIKSPIKNLFIPSLLVQPFVENAIVHGLSKRKDGRLDVIFKESGKNIFVHVIDNGVGRNNSKKKTLKVQLGTSSALKILEERASFSSISSKQNYNFKIIDRIENGKIAGTHVLLRISIGKNKI